MYSKIGNHHKYNLASDTKLRDTQRLKDFKVSVGLRLKRRTKLLKTKRFGISKTFDEY